MAVKKRTDNKKWEYRTVVILPNGKKKRISGIPKINTRLAAVEAERNHINRLLRPNSEKVAAPTFREWWAGDSTDQDKPNGRFWVEWVVGKKNKPSEVESKISIYRNHLEPVFGDMPLDEINLTEVARFRTKLVTRKPPLTEKTINNILAVLSKPLHYAEDVGIIVRAPKVGLFKVERPEIEFWEVEEYAALLAAARAYKPVWYAAVCLAGEAGMRIGEVKALRWIDVDMKAGTLTVNQQVRHGVVGTPKGRTRRTILMTKRLMEALRSMDAIRTGYVIRTPDGHMFTDNQAEWAITAICRRAKLSVRKWHTLRHSFATHAAAFGANPWTLMGWMGHKRIEETQLYVSIAKAHARTIGEDMLQAGAAETDPDRRILAMLDFRGTSVAQTSASEKKVR